MKKMYGITIPTLNNCMIINAEPYLYVYEVKKNSINNLAIYGSCKIVNVVDFHDNEVKEETNKKLICIDTLKRYRIKNYEEMILNEEFVDQLFGNSNFCYLFNDKNIAKILKYKKLEKIYKSLKEKFLNLENVYIKYKNFKISQKGQILLSNF